MLGVPFVAFVQQNNNGPSPGPSPSTLPLIATLQMGNAMAGVGVLTPNFYQRTNLMCVVTFFDPITLQEADPDVGSVTPTLVAPDGSSPSVAVTRLGVGTFAMVPFLALVGLYQLSVTATRGGLATTIEGNWNSQPPMLSTTPVQSAEVWVFVTASQSPYQAVPISPNIAVDLRQGVVAVQFWPNPSDGDEMTVKDWYDLSSQGSTGRGQPGGPIQLSAANGVTFENPSEPGTYGATGWIAAPGGFGGTWKYSLQANSWTLKNHG